MQRQLLTLSGLASVIVVVIAYAGVGGSTPDTDESAATIKAFYVDHGSRQMAASYLIALAIPLLIIFASAVRSMLVEAREGKAAVWANVFFGGALLAGAGFLTSATLHLALTSSTETLSSSAVQAMNAVDSESWLAFSAGLGVMLLGAAGAMIPAVSGLRWLGFLALVLGVLIFTPLGFAGFIGSGLWIALTSVALTMRTRTPQTALRTPVAG